MIGGGSWATALCKVLLEDRSRSIAWWVRSDEVAAALARRGRNPHHLSGLRFDPSRLAVSTRLSEVVERCDLLVLAVPSAYLGEVLQQAEPSLWAGRRVASAVKGFIPSEGCSVSQYVERHLLLPPEAVCIISGPSHAEEVAAGKTTFLDIASSHRPLADEVAAALACSYIHTVVSDDVKSLELCGLAKNVYAICSGMLAAMGGGDNLTAVLTSAAAHELHGMIGIPRPVFPFLGDLMVTCFSRHSRNRALGEAVMQGISPQEHFRRTGMVAEGWTSSKVLYGLDKTAPTPIADAVYRVLYLDADPTDEMQHLIDHVL